MSKYTPEETYETHENDGYNKGKLSFAKWIDNVWYHYKWTIILGGAIIAFLVVALVQLFRNEEPDVYIMHVGPMLISPAAAEDIDETVAGMAYDCNDDGEVNVNVLDITINKFSNESGDVVVNYDENNKGFMRFQTEIRAGDAIIYLLDEPYFEVCVEEGILAPLDTVVDDAYMPEKVISGYGVKLSDLKAYELDGLSNVPETAILCLRRAPEEDDISYGRTMESWECSKTAFVNIIKYGN